MAKRVERHSRAERAAADAQNDEVLEFCANIVRRCDDVRYDFVLVIRKLRPTHIQFVLAAIFLYKTESCICLGCVRGKLFVANAILTKESFLTTEEKECITRHTHLGFEAIEGELNEDEYETIKNIVLYHHERCDGTGYEKMKGLPFYIDIVAVCDVYDALNSDRVYRKKFSREKSLEIIRSGGCGFFEESLIECLEKASEEIDS